MENHIEKVKAMLSDYANFAGESSVARTKAFTSPSDIYKSLEYQAAARVSVKYSYSGAYLRYYFI